MTIRDVNLPDMPTASGNQSLDCLSIAVIRRSTLAVGCHEPSCCCQLCAGRNSFGVQPVVSFRQAIGDHLRPFPAVAGRNHVTVLEPVSCPHVPRVGGSPLARGLEVVSDESRILVERCGIALLDGRGEPAMAVGPGGAQLGVVTDCAHQRVPKRVSNFGQKLDLVDDSAVTRPRSWLASTPGISTRRLSRPKLVPITAAALRIDFSRVVSLSMRAARTACTVAGTAIESTSACEPIISTITAQHRPADEISNDLFDKEWVAGGRLRDQFSGTACSGLLADQLGREGDGGRCSQW